MFDVDQDLRSSASDWQLSKKVLNSPLNWGVLNFLVYAMDGINNYNLHKLIQEHGYPSKKLVGKRGMYWFFVLIIHQDNDGSLQNKCLENCDFEIKDRAYLIDRIKVNQGKKQVYGTQFQYDSQKQILMPKPIENPKDVDKRRKKCGLDPLKVEMATINKNRLKMAKLNHSKLINKSK